MVVCLERGADLHMAQRVPLPLTVSCYQIGFTFLVPDKRPLNVCIAVCTEDLHTSVGSYSVVQDATTSILGIRHSAG